MTPETDLFYWVWFAQVQSGAGAGEPQVSTQAKRSTLGDTCTVCGKKVYIMERHIDGNKLYHRKCLREIQRSQRSSLSPTQKQFQQWKEEASSSQGYLPRKDLTKTGGADPKSSLVKTLQAAAEVKENGRSGSPTGAKSAGLMKALYAPPQSYKSDSFASSSGDAKQTAVANAKPRPFETTQGTAFQKYEPGRKALMSGQPEPRPCSHTSPLPSLSPPSLSLWR